MLHPRHWKGDRQEYIEMEGGKRKREREREKRETERERAREREERRLSCVIPFNLITNPVTN